jgi:hypothetical protein
MKENNFYSDDFERLIRDKTEQYKMYPSENVWKGVHNSLHTKRRWFIGSMSVLVTGILFLAGRELIAPARVPATHKTAVAGSVADADFYASKGSAANDNTSRNLLPSLRQPNTSPSRHNDAAGASDEQDPAYSDITITINNPVLTQSDLSGWLSRVVRLPDHAPDLAVVDAKMTGADQDRTTEEASAMRRETRQTTEGATTSKDDGVELTASGVLESLSARSAVESRSRDARLRRAGTRTLGGTVLGNGNLPDSTGAATRASAAAIAEAEDKLSLYWMQVTAMNILDPPTKGNRTYLELTLTPTVNFRSLSGNVPEDLHTLGTQSFSSAPNSPALGFEVGGSMLYRVTRNLSLKAGLQFNFSRFNVHAYTAAGPSQSAANQTYYTYFGYTGFLTTLTNQANSSPATVNQIFSSQETLNVDYFQLSAPVGFELRVLGNERLQLNVGATIEPSYLFNTNSYVVSQDFTEYMKAPSTFRRWNLNGGVQAFLSYRTGDIRWEAGPEFHYQFFSSYNSQNPIIENVKGYGLRIGITKPLP